MASCRLGCIPACSRNSNSRIFGYKRHSKDQLNTKNMKLLPNCDSSKSMIFVVLVHPSVFDSMVLASYLS